MQSDNLRLLLAVVLSLGILILWQVLFPPEPPRPPEPLREAVTQPEVVAETGDEGTEGTDSPPAEPPPEEPPPVAGKPVEAETETRTVVETEEIRAEFTNRGAQLISFRLKEHLNLRGEPLDLVRARKGGPYPFALVGPKGDPLALQDALFVVETEETAAGGQQLSFRYRGPAGAAEKRFHFTGDSLLEVEIRVPGRQEWGVLLGPGIRNPTAEELGRQFQSHGAVYRLGEEVERLDPAGTAEPTVIPGPGLRWVGLEDTYFLAALIPRTPVRQVVLQPVLLWTDEEGTVDRYAPVPTGVDLGQEEKGLNREFVVLLQPSSQSLEAAAYWGAKEYDRLASLPYGLHKTVNLGIFWFLARPLQVGLLWIHEHVVHNFGWAIILMTALLKLLLLPLTHKSYVSMQKMQELNPKIQAIRSRYRGKLKDKHGKPNVEAQRKMNEEIMGLYRSEGVNPAGGCLPMLLQLPILFAFYNLLTAAVELRNAPWFLWIQDLSAPDPYYALPIVMGATQFLQQRMTPASGDPMQRRIFQLMPIFFTILFLGFPSGLVLYWLTNNVLTIFQQAVYNQMKKAAAPEKRKAEGKGRKRRASSKA